MSTDKDKSEYKVCIDTFPNSRFVYTFSYLNNSTFENLINSHIACDKWKLAGLFDNENTELYEHISALIVSQNKNLKESIAVSLKSEVFSELFLKYSDKKNSFEFYIKNVWLVLFKTNIGFVIIDTCLSQESSIDDLINFNYTFKSIKLTANDGLFRVDNSRKLLKRNQTMDEEFFNSIGLFPLAENEKYRQITINDDIRPKLEAYFLKDGTEILSVNEIKQFKRNGEEEIQFNYTTREKFDYKSFILCLLEKIQIGTFFNSFESKSYGVRFPSKAHVFTVASLRHENQSQLDEVLFWLRKAYKKSYIPSEEAKNLTNNEEVLRSFSDSIWGVSREAVANIIFDRCTFLSENYHYRLDVYFFLYLLVLHQYYGLLLIAKDATELSSSAEHYIVHKEYNKLKQIRERLNFFYLKCIFNEISHISHQSNLYKHMLNRLGVQSILSEIQFEIERITSITDDVREERDTRQRESQEGRNRIFIIIAAIFTFVSTFEAIWSVFSMASESYKEFGENPLRIFLFTLSPPHIIFWLTIISIFLCCILGVAVFILLRFLNNFSQKEK